LADVPESIAIDLVDVFRAAEHAPAIVEECIALGVPRLWFQQGIFHEAACARAREAGIFVVADRCLMVDYASHCRKDS
jgi:predicted CoA-binding protein